MYESLKQLVASLLKTPTEPPAPPAGSHASTKIFRASPKYLTYRLLGLYIGAGVLAVMILFGGAGLLVALSNAPDDARLVMIGSAALVVVPMVLSTLLNYFATRLDYELRYYILTDRSLRIREGVWIVREITLTHANIQNLRVSQGPLQRFFGISDVLVETAGGGGAATPQQGAAAATGHRAVLAGLEDAEVVRDQIRAYLQTTRDAGLGDDDDGHDAARGLSPAAMTALREVAQEALRLRGAVAGRA